MNHGRGDGSPHKALRSAVEYGEMISNAFLKNKKKTKNAKQFRR